MAAREANYYNAGDGNGRGYKRKADIDVMEIGSFGSFGVGEQQTTAAEMYSDKLDLFSPGVSENVMEYFRYGNQCMLHAL